MNNLKKYLIENGASIVEYANLEGIPITQRNYLNFGISIGVSLNPEVIKSIEEGPNVHYQKEYTRVNQLLDDIGKLAVDYIQKKGFKGYVLTSTISTQKNNLIDLSTPLPHKTVATIAGVGWIGKSALLVTKEYGSAIRLTTVLTDMYLDINKSQESYKKSCCAECMECVKVCPANAILGRNWRLGLNRDYFYNAIKCRQTITQMIKDRHNIQDLICGKCILACPWTKNYINKSIRVP